MSNCQPLQKKNWGRGAGEGRRDWERERRGVVMMLGNLQCRGVPLI